MHALEDRKDPTIHTMETGLMIMGLQERGLSSAVLKGFDMAAGKFVICMDGDLQHPPEKVPEFLKVRAIYPCHRIKYAFRTTFEFSSVIHIKLQNESSNIHDCCS
jgi:glycosyltransferase involved in cell wall biosynthesis